MTTPSRERTLGRTLRPDHRKKTRTKRGPVPPPTKGSGAGLTPEAPTDPEPTLDEVELGVPRAVLRATAERVSLALVDGYPIFAVAIAAHAVEHHGGSVHLALGHLFGEALTDWELVCYSPAARRYLPGPCMKTYREGITPAAAGLAPVVRLVPRAKVSP